MRRRARTVNIAVRFSQDETRRAQPGDDDETLRSRTGIDCLFLRWTRPFISGQCNRQMSLAPLGGKICRGYISRGVLN